MNTKKKFALLVMIMGGLIIFSSIVTGASIVVSFSKVLIVHNFSDARSTVVRVVFDFILPFAGGIMLLIAGYTILSEAINHEVEHRAGSIITTKKEEIKKEKSKIINMMLDDDEREVIEIIQINGSSLQSDIVGRTGFSKVKVHRILKRLEQKGLIKRARFGITNKVYVSDSTAK